MNFEVTEAEAEDDEGPNDAVDAPDEEAVIEPGAPSTAAGSAGLMLSDGRTGAEAGVAGVDPEEDLTADPDHFSYFSSSALSLSSSDIFEGSIGGCCKGCWTVCAGAS